MVPQGPAILRATFQGPSARGFWRRKGTDLASTASTATHELTYDRFTILLHWLTAFLVVTLWALGQSIGFFPEGPFRKGLLGVHILLGITVGAVVLVRIGWRLSRGRRLPSADQGALEWVAKGAHLGLYLLLVLTVAFGVGRAWVHGVEVFHWFTFPRPAFATRAVTRTVSEVHGDLGDIIVIVAGLHAAAALFHHYGLRDSVLRRMLPGKRRD